MAPRKKKAIQKYRKKRTNYAGYMNTASKALQIALATKRLLNVETKYHDATFATSVSSSGQMEVLSAVPQGDTQITRDGSSLKPKSLTMRFRVTQNASASSTFYRIIVFRGKYENGVVPTFQDILENNGLLSPKNHDDRFKTKWLVDKTFMINQNFTLSNPQKEFTLYFPLTGHIQFDGNTTNIENGGLYVYMLTDEPTNVPTIAYHSRLTFIDN